jgi:hypothetical protein
VRRRPPAPACCHVGPPGQRLPLPLHWQLLAALLRLVPAVHRQPPRLPSAHAAQCPAWRERAARATGCRRWPPRLPLLRRLWGHRCCCCCCCCCCCRQARAQALPVTRQCPRSRPRLLARLAPRRWQLQAHLEPVAVRPRAAPAMQGLLLQALAARPSWLPRR